MKIKTLNVTNTGLFANGEMAFAPTPDRQSQFTVITGYTSTGKTLLMRTLSNGLSWYIARLKDERVAGIVQPDADVRIVKKSEVSVDVDQSMTTIQPSSKVEITLASNRHLQPSPLAVPPVAKSFNIEVTVTSINAATADSTQTYTVSTPNTINTVDTTTPIQPVPEQLYSYSLFKVLNEQGVGTSRVSLDSLMQLLKLQRDELNVDPLASVPIITYYPVERNVADISLATKIQPHGQLTGYDPLPHNTVNFTRFYEWFRDQEDFENERIAKAHRALFTTHDKRYQQAELSAVYASLEFAHRRALTLPLDCARRAIETIMPDLTNLRFERHPLLKIVVDKCGETVNISQLSQSEKMLMSMVGDIARRLITQNPALHNPLEGEGIVMIDELELHLHPENQRAILQRLGRVFPNCQFIVTTQSPDIYADIDAVVYSLHHGQIERIDHAKPFDVQQLFSFAQPLVNEAVSVGVSELVTASVTESTETIVTSTGNFVHPADQLVQLMQAQQLLFDQLPDQISRLRIENPDLLATVNQFSQRLQQLAIQLEAIDQASSALATTHLK